MILWKALIAACKQYNVQLVATTHSYECIEALSNSYTELDPKGDDIRLYRLDRDNEKHTAYLYNAELIKAGIKDLFEETLTGVIAFIVYWTVNAFTLKLIERKI